jgi:hypothetical protein
MRSHAQHAVRPRFSKCPLPHHFHRASTSGRDTEDLFGSVGTQGALTPAPAIS